VLSACIARWDAVVHLVDPEDLRVSAVGTQFVILAHDERLDGLWGTLRSTVRKNCSGQVEIEVIQNFDFLSGLAVAAKRDQIIGHALAHWSHTMQVWAPTPAPLQPQHAAEPRRHGRRSAGTGT
jgi:hypothetical protein